MRLLGGASEAVTFLTRVPLPGSRGRAGAQLRRAVPWFPLVGAAVGGILGGTRLLADMALPPGPSTALALLAAIVVTGALHEDGLADTADGLGARATPERKLEIMRDPRVGTYGALALLGSLLIAWSLLSTLEGTDCLRAAVTAHALARWAMPLAAAAFPPARVEGAGALMTVGRLPLALATAVAAGIALAACGPAVGGAALVGTPLVALAVGAYTTRAVGGVSGDVYGAIGKAVEVSAFAFLVAVWGQG